MFEVLRCNRRPGERESGVQNLQVDVSLCRRYQLHPYIREQVPRSCIRSESLAMTPRAEVRGQLCLIDHDEFLDTVRVRPDMSDPVYSTCNSEVNATPCSPSHVHRVQSTYLTANLILC